jgi:hypothetical protein
MARRVVWTAQAQADDIRGLERPIAPRILKTPARHAQTGEGDTKPLQGVAPPLIRLRAQDYRVLFRDKGAYLEISRVLDRKQACRYTSTAAARLGRIPFPPLIGLARPDSSGTAVLCCMVHPLFMGPPRRT